MSTEAEAKTTDVPVAMEDVDVNGPSAMDMEIVDRASSTPESKEVVTMESLRKMLKDSCFESASNDGNAGQVKPNQDGDDRLFAESTHSFLIYFESETEEKLSKLIIGLFVIAVQTSLYITISQEPMKDLGNDKFLIPVKVEFGDKCAESLSTLKCPPEVANIGYCGMAALLLSFFLMRDIVASFRIFAKVPGLFAKLAAAAIVFEVFVALFCGGLFAVSANEGYEAVANCVGVLFIHDMGEKAFQAYEVLKLQEIATCQARCCKCCGCLTKTRLAGLFIVSVTVVFLVLMSGLVFQQSRKDQVLNDAAYGEGWWSQNGEW